MTFRVNMASVHDDVTLVSLTIYTTSQFTVAEFVNVARMHGCYDDGFNDSGNVLEHDSVVDVVEGRITDRYCTIGAGNLTPEDVELLLEREHYSALEANGVYFGATTDDINPFQTGLLSTHSIYDRLLGDDVLKHEGCTAHDRVGCPCEDGV